MCVEPMLKQINGCSLGGAHHEDLVAILRRLQTVYPLDAALKIAAIALISIGVSWAALQFLRAHPYILVIGAGLVCWAASLVSRGEGLLIHLPDAVQDVLLRRTLFDFIRDNARSTNFRRRWMRIMMLCGTTDAGDIQRIVEGMDPTWIEAVFRSTFIEYLPQRVCRLLLPESPGVGHYGPRAVADGRPQSGVARWRNHVHAIQAVSRMRLRMRHGGDSAQLVLTPEEIARVVREREEDVKSRITEPPWLPVVARLSGRRIALAVMMPGRQAVFKALKLVSACAAACCGTSLLVRVPRTQYFLLRGLSVVGIARGYSKEALITRSSRWASLLGALSAFLCVILRTYSQRLPRLQDARYRA